MCAHFLWCAWGGRRTMCGNQSSPPCRFGDQTGVIRLDSECTYLLSPLKGPHFIFLRQSFPLIWNSGFSRLGWLASKTQRSACLWTKTALTPSPSQSFSHVFWSHPSLPVCFFGAKASCYSPGWPELLKVIPLPQSYKYWDLRFEPSLHLFPYILILVAKVLEPFHHSLLFSELSWPEGRAGLTHSGWWHLLIEPLEVQFGGGDWRRDWTCLGVLKRIWFQFTFLHTGFVLSSVFSD